VRDRAVGAVSGADVAEDHEGRGAVLPALADIRAVRFFADRMEVQIAHQVLQADVVLSTRRLHFEPGRLSVGKGFDPVSPTDLVKRFAHLWLPEATGPVLYRSISRVSLREANLRALIYPVNSRVGTAINLL
jgi:hypothetical protein